MDYYDHESAKSALETLNGRKIMENVCFKLFLRKIVIFCLPLLLTD